MDKQVFKRTMLCSVVIGFITHGYYMTNFAYSHDSLQMLYISGAGNDYHIGLGRPFVALYDKITSTSLVSPFLTGLQVILWLGLAAYFFVRTFDIDDPIRILIVSGVFESNLMVMTCFAGATADSAPYCFGVFCASVAAWLWRRNTLEQRWGYLICSAALLASSLLTYQGDGAVFTVTILFCLICDSCSKEDSHAIRNGLFAMLIVALSGILYFAVVKSFLWAHHTEMIQGGYNSLSNAWTSDESIISRVCAVYLDVKTRLWNQVYAVSYQWIVKFVNIAVILLSMIIVCVRLIANVRSRKKGVTGDVLVSLLLFVVFPFAVNYGRLFNQVTHQIMFFGLWMMYLLPVVLLSCSDIIKRGLFSERNGRRERIAGIISVILAILIIVNNVQVSNAGYLKKDLEYERFQSTMTDVLDKVESVDGYKEGETKVCFVGTPADALQPTYISTSLNGIWGMGSFVATSATTYSTYAEFILGRDNLLFIEPTELSNDDISITDTMPVWPDQGSIMKNNDVVIVKFKD